MEVFLERESFPGELTILRKIAYKAADSPMMVIDNRKERKAELASIADELAMLPLGSSTKRQDMAIGKAIQDIRHLVNTL